MFDTCMSPLVAVQVVPVRTAVIVVAATVQGRGEAPAVLLTLFLKVTRAGTGRSRGCLCYSFTLISLGYISTLLIQYT